MRESVREQESKRAREQERERESSMWSVTSTHSCADTQHANPHAYVRSACRTCAEVRLGSSHTSVLCTPLPRRAFLTAGGPPLGEEFSMAGDDAYSAASGDCVDGASK